MPIPNRIGSRLPRARAARREHQADRAGVSEQEIVAQLHEIGPLGGSADPGRNQDLGTPLRLLRQLLDRPPLLIETEQRKDREQNGHAEQDGGDSRKKPLHPQPQVKPDAAVNPGNEKHRRLDHPQVRPRHPMQVQGLRIASLQPVQSDPQALADQWPHSKAGMLRPNTSWTISITFQRKCRRW
jgi:hypothetical protein